MNTPEPFHNYHAIFRMTRESISVIDRHFVYSDVNDAYCAAMRRDRDAIVGKSVAELWGGEQFTQLIRENLVRCFSGETVRYKAWFEFIPGERRCYRVECFPLNSDSSVVTHAMIVTTDITDLARGDAERRQHEQDMSFLYETAIGFVEMAHSDKVYDYLAERLWLLTANSIIMVNSFHQPTNSLRVEHVAGLGGFTEKIYQLMGGAVKGRSYPVKDYAIENMLNGRMIDIDGGLHKLSFGVIPAPICASIEKMLGINRIYVMGMVSNGSLFGSAVIMAHEEIPEARLHLIETCINQTSIALLRRRVVEELNRSEERMRILFDTAPDAYFLAMEMKIVDGNAAFERLTGKNKDEMRGRNLADIGLFKDEEAHRLSTNFNALLTGSSARTEEYQVDGAGGRKMAVELRMHPMTIEGLPHVLGIIRDISDRKKIIEEIRKLAQFVYESPSPMMRVSGAGKLLYATPSSRPLLTQWKSEVDQQVPDDILTHIRDVLRSGEKMTVEVVCGEQLYSFEVVPLAAMNYVNLYGRDITDARRSEQAVRESEEKYRALFEESRDVVFISTPEGKFVDINRAGLELFGAASREELLTLDIPSTIYLNPSDRTLFTAAMERDGYVRDYELQLKQLNGQARIVLVTASVVKDKNGVVVAYRGTLRDITESRKMEKQLFQSQKMESLGLLASGIAHDFNNLLTGIMGYSSYLKTKISRDDSLFESVDIIEEGAKQAAELTQQLLTFARGGRYNVAPTDVNDIVRNTLKLINRTIDKLIEIETRFNDTIPLADVDALQIGQVVVNLCVNARDAMPRGGRLIIETGKETVGDDFVRKHADAHIGSYVYISIADTGQGMSKETVARIFEPFYSTKELGRGTGMGMSVVYGIIKKHGGFITIHSELNHGTTIKVYLPSTTKARLEQKAEKLVAARGRGETILVIDDEAAILLLVKRICEGNGYLVLTAGNGIEALDIFAEKKDDIALVIMDMMMPKMDSQEVLRRLQEIKPGLKVLLATGYGQSERAKAMITAGVAGIIPKPFNVQEILGRVRALLDRDKT